MTRSLLTALIFLAALLATMSGAVAQDSTPVTDVAADGCDVTPRTDDEIAALNATAAAGLASPIAIAPMELPQGEPVDASVLNALDATLRQVDACARAGNLPALLALYSDNYVAGIALAPEPEPIVPGTGHAHPGGPVGTPEPDSGVAPQVETAVLLADGRVAATVNAGASEDIVFFVNVDGIWQIDEIHESLPVGPVGGDLPFPVQAAVASAAAEFGVSLDEVVVDSFEPIEWNDSSLGCPKDGEFYAQVITPGYQVTLTVAGVQHSYHTDEIDRAVRCDQE